MSVPDGLATFAVVLVGMILTAAVMEHHARVKEQERLRRQARELLAAGARERAQVRREAAWRIAEHRGDSDYLQGA